MTCEPFVDGAALSICRCCVGAGWPQALSFNRQRIEIDVDGVVRFARRRRPRSFDASDPRGLLLHLLAPISSARCPGLRGFVGIDLVWHRGAARCVIEINPRVTSAYVGLSQRLRPQPGRRYLLARSAQELVTLPTTAARPPLTIGWDIGGAHVKACRVERGEVRRRRAVGLPAVAGPGAARAACCSWPGAAGRARRCRRRRDSCAMRDDDRRDGRPVRRPRGRRAALAARLADVARQRLRLYAGAAPRRSAARPAGCWVAVDGVDAALAGDRVGQLAGDRAMAVALLRRGAAGRYRQHHDRPDRAARRPRRPPSGAATPTGWPAANWSTRASCARRCARWASSVDIPRSRRAA